MGTDFRPPVVFLCRGAGRARNESAAVRSACGGVQSGILPGPEGLEGPGVVLSCNLPGQAMQRIPPVYYLCR